MSSAKSEQKLFTVDGMSLTNSVNSNGPNTYPWGIPLIIEIVLNLLQPFVLPQLGCLYTMICIIIQLHVTYFWLLLVVRQHLIGSQVLTRCPPLFVVHGIQAVVESRSSREIDNIPQI